MPETSISPFQGLFTGRHSTTERVVGRRHQEKSKDSSDQAVEAGSDEAEEDHFAVLDDFWQGESLVNLAVIYHDQNPFE